MKAGVLHARDDIRYEEVQTPEPKAGEVLVKVKYSSNTTFGYYFFSNIGYRYISTKGFLFRDRKSVV